MQGSTSSSLKGKIDSTIGNLESLKKEIELEYEKMENERKEFNEEKEEIEKTKKLIETISSKGKTIVVIYFYLTNLTLVSLIIIL